MVAGSARIQVTFQVDADGLLNVSAREETTGAQSSVTVKPSFGLSDDEVSHMLQASFSHAEQDKQARQLAERRLEARQLLDGLEAALAADGDALLTPDECAELHRGIKALRTTVDGDDAGSLKAETEALGRASEFFATRRMDRSIRQALAGVSLDALDDEVSE
jgi:molecular chaperone HscA